MLVLDCITGLSMYFSAQRLAVLPLTLFVRCFADGVWHWQARLSEARVSLNRLLPSLALLSVRPLNLFERTSGRNQFFAKKRQKQSPHSF